MHDLFITARLEYNEYTAGDFLLVWDDN